MPSIFLTGYNPDAVPPDMTGIVRLQTAALLRTIVDAIEQLEWVAINAGLTELPHC